MSHSRRPNRGFTCWGSWNLNRNYQFNKAALCGIWADMGKRVDYCSILISRSRTDTFHFSAAKILWGVLFFGELKSAGWMRWTTVCGGAALMFFGGLVLARVSTNQMSSHIATRGIAAALGAGVLWGTMYIPYRKAYL